VQVCEVVRSLLASELSRLRGVVPEQLAEELEDLRAAHKAEQELAASGVSWNVSSVARAPTLRLPLMLVCALQAGQQCSGINAVSVLQWCVHVHTKHEIKSTLM
jgi:hypothetical protein